MQFHLVGTIQFNAPLEAHEPVLAELLAAANTGILAKGAPEGKGAVVEHWSIEASVLRLTISSQRYVRAHDGLVRLKKFFGEQLGRKYKLGVRKTTIEDYTIGFELARPPLHAISIPFATVAIDGNWCTLRLTDCSDEFLRKNYIDRMISVIRSKIDAQYYEGKAEKWELVWASAPREPFWTTDPTEEMLARGWLKQGPTKGKWFYRPQFAAIIRAMERLALEHVLLPLGFEEVIEPHHVPFSVWQRTGHMVGVPNEIYYICEPRTRDLVAWEPFIDRVKITHEVPTELLQGLLAPPNAGSCYAQCPVIYWSLAGATVATDSLPIKIFDRTAISNRYESGGRHGIERVDEFHRIEPVYIGTPQQLAALREQLIERYRYVFEQILELEWRMARVTPFYQAQSGELGDEPESEPESEPEPESQPAPDAEGAPHTATMAELSKIKGTVDFEAYLPYRGTREGSEWLEFQNLSVLGTKFTDAFNIKPQNPKTVLWSGCSGIGLERWAATFLAQKGLEPAHWPAGFRSYLPQLPKGITLL